MVNIEYLLTATSRCVKRRPSLCPLPKGEWETGRLEVDCGTLSHNLLPKPPSHRHTNSAARSGVSSYRIESPFAW